MLGMKGWLEPRNDVDDVGSIRVSSNDHQQVAQHNSRLIGQSQDEAHGAGLLRQLEDAWRVVEKGKTQVPMEYNSLSVLTGSSGYQSMSWWSLRW